MRNAMLIIFIVCSRIADTSANFDLISLQLSRSVSCTAGRIGPGAAPRAARWER
jgi:hypothetical protein